jgi:HSP20 family protein
MQFFYVQSLSFNTMTLLKRKKNDLFPSLSSDLLEGTFLSPRLFDFDSDLWNGGLMGPAANISETNTEYKIDLSVPGLKKDDFKIEVDNGTLTVSCEKEEEKKDDNKKYKRREYSYNSFSRTFQLPENVKDDQINAKYENGLLCLTIPKKETSISKPKKQIQISGE